MAVIEGDIDLTQNLDFYRKKPKKLLPANVSLRGRDDGSRDDNKSKSDININTFREYYFTTTSNSVIRFFYNNDSSSGWAINRNNESFDYIDIYDQDSTEYIDINDGRATTSYRMNYTNSYINSNSISSTTITSTSRYHITANNYSLDNEDFGWQGIHYKKNKFLDSAIDTAKKVFSLWSSRESKEKDSLTLQCCYSCYSCGVKFLVVPNKAYFGSYCRCKKCAREEYIKEKQSIWSRDNSRKNAFRFNHKERSDNYDYFEDIPWDIKRTRNRKPKRYGIPWFQYLDSRIYHDYIDELLYGEKDYSSYLTNMGWIGISRHSDSDRDIV